MKYLKFTWLLAAGLLLLPGNHSQAQYTITGTNAQGGHVVIGSGVALPPLGPGAPLSGTGFDQVTIQAGAVVPATSTAVNFQTSHNTLLNLGTVNFTSNGFYFSDAGGSNTGNSVTNAAVLTSNGLNAFGINFQASGMNINNKILNSGSLGTGGGSNLILVIGNAGNSGNAIINSGIISTNLGGGSTMVQFGTGADNTGNSILNSGTMEDGGNSTIFLMGASGNNIGNSIVNSGLIDTNGGSGNNPIIFYSNSGTNSGNLALNSGTITTDGGSSVPGIFFNANSGANSSNSVSNTGLINLGDSSQGLYLYAVTGNSNNTVSNTGSINVGANSQGIYLYASSGANSGNNVSSSGTINAGVSSYGFYLNAASSNLGNTVANSGLINGGAGDIGIDLVASTNNSGNTVSNSGNIRTGNSSFAIFLNASTSNTANTVANSGNINTGNSSYGVLIGASNSSTGNTVANSGNISAGNGSYAVIFNSDTNAGNTVFNSGNIISGNSGYSVLFNAFPTNTGNTLVNFGNIIAGNNSYPVLYNAGTNTGNSLVNFGNIISGNNGYAVLFEASTTNLNNTLVNFGTIRSGSGGYSVLFSAGTNTGNTLNNWGLISTGPGGTAIDVNSGGGNVVNLNGHSSTIGKIAISGLANSNVVNLNFTGVSPAVINLLKPLLLVQGVNSGVDTNSVIFTLRGVTYNIDAAIVNFNLTSYQLQGLTPNQAAIGRSLDGIAYNPAPGTPLFNLYNAIDLSGNVPAALEELSPQKYELYGDLAIQNATALVQGMDARLNNLLDGSESVDTTGLGGGVTSGAIVTGDPSKDGGGKETKEVVQPAPQENRWGFFATGNGLFFRGNTRSADLQDGKSNTAGTLAGVDGKVGDHAVIGALFAYDNSAAVFDGSGGHATIESYSGGLYGSWHDSGFYANSLAAYTRNTYSATRNIAIPGFAGGAGGSTSGNQATVNIDGGYDWHVTDRLTAGPILGLQYVHLDVDGFNESGLGVASLAIGSQSMDSLQSRLGGRLDYHIATTSTSSFAAELYAAWQHEYLDDSRSINAGFEGTGLAPFSIQTAAPLRDAAVVGVSLNFTFHNRLTLFAGYELQMWQASSFEQTINGGAKISF